MEPSPLVKTKMGLSPVIAFGDASKQSPISIIRQIYELEEAVIDFTRPVNEALYYFDPETRAYLVPNTLSSLLQAYHVSVLHASGTPVEVVGPAHTKFDLASAHYSKALIAEAAREADIPSGVADEVAEALLGLL
eukprot:gnl/Chilomastix_cuspidata/5206.p1 GENE.gnl/Chilomastix_cuspidata/5206~~gnl/Chilomastix_cuspidata/5206.p1  ORF type:complete len:135 (+),score=49.00 gnl/Chilomastix_cuspidata/5206:80-484(+)